MLVGLEDSVYITRCFSTVVPHHQHEGREEKGRKKERRREEKETTGPQSDFWAQKEKWQRREPCWSP